VLKRGLREQERAQGKKRIVLSVLGAVASVAICFAASREELVFASGALATGLLLWFVSRSLAR
jgi:hypothetical protein